MIQEAPAVPTEKVQTSEGMFSVSNVGNNDTSKTAPPGFHWDRHTSTLQPNS